MEDLIKENNNKNGKLTSAKNSIFDAKKNLMKEFETFSLVDLIDYQFEQYATQDALIYKNKTISYQELNKLSDTLAERIRWEYHQLNGKDIDDKTFIPILFDKGIDLIIAIIGVIKSGAAYIPLSPDYPEDRIQYIIEDSGADIIVCDKLYLNKIESKKENSQLHQITGFTFDRIKRPTKTNEITDLAYLLYTSGTTGKPKGVMVRQNSLINLILNQTRAYHFTEDENVILSSNHIFDASIENIFLALLNGAKLFIPSSDDIKDPTIFKQMLEFNRISHLHATPSFLSALGDCGELPNLKRIVTGGDKCPKSLQQIWGERLVNSYGPTETTVTVSMNLCHDVSKANNNIGKPIDKVNFYVLDQSLNRIPIGEMGELYISGIALSNGYLNKDTLTQNHFISNPYSEVGHEILYKTGDLVVCQQDGSYEYIGRNDRQVKVRGYRIEPAEIEASLCLDSLVDQALVKAEATKETHKLIAYLVGKDLKDSDITAIKEKLAKSLPDYMIPSLLVPLEKWPLTLAGKIDHEQLPTGFAPLRKGELILANSPDEEILVNEWKNIFELDDLGVNDDFFALGGDSITAIRFMSRLRSLLNRHLTMKQFKQDATIQGVLANSQLEQIDGLTTKAIDKGKTEFPLSNQQMVAWYMHKNQPDSKAYLAEAATHFKGRFVSDALENSINQIFINHDIYRTRFTEIDGRIVQTILPEYKMSLRSIDALTVTEQDKEAFLEHTFKTELDRIEDLSQLPLAEFILVRFDEEHHVLLHQEHHIIHDGWSANEFTNELIHHYHRFVNSEFKTPYQESSQYSSFVLSQQAWLDSKHAEKQKSYWKKQLEGAPQGVALFGKKSHSLGFAGSHEKMIFTREQWHAMETLCRDIGITPFSYTSSILYLCLGRFSGEQDLSFGSAFANRNWADSHATLGMFVNTVVLRHKLNLETPLFEFLQNTQNIVDQAQANEELPFPLVVEALNPERGSASNPFFNVLLGFHDTPVNEHEIEGLSWYKDETVISDTSKFDIDCLVVPRGKTFNESEEVHFLWEYRNDIYTQDEIQRFLSAFKTSFLNILGEYRFLSHQPISAIDVLTEQERKQILSVWGQGAPLSHNTSETFKENGLVTSIREKAKSLKDKTAIQDNQETLSYGKLDIYSNALAQQLKNNGYQEGDKIAIHCQRNTFNLIAMLAVFKLGACAVMLGSDLPKQRLKHILLDSQAKLIIDDGSLVGVNNLPCNQIVLNNALFTSIQDTHFEASQYKPDASAYVIYTSGSTGQPKGIEISQLALYKMSLWHIDEFKLDENSVGTSLAYVGFDAFMAEVWPILMAGGKLVLVPDAERDSPSALMQLMKAQQVTHTCLPTGLLTHVFANQVHWPRSLKTLLTGGDVLGDIRLPEDFDAAFYNLYGPTETCVDACFYKVDINNIKDVPIGRPVSHAKARVLVNGQIAPIGVPGELYVAGDGIAKGYLNNDELNKKVFIPDCALSGKVIDPNTNPMSASAQTSTQERYYRTGDLVKWNQDGQLIFLGRLNDEIKVRGFRVALGEINYQLETSLDVKQAYSIVSDAAIYSYVVVKNEVKQAWLAGQGSERKLVRQLRRQLKAELPEYMCPNAIILMDEIPMTAQGKVDKAKLDSPLSTDTPFEPASSMLEKELSLIWQKHLDKTELSIHANFFSLGGHSLLAMNIIAEIQRQFFVQLSISDFFNNPNIKAQASFIQAVIDSNVSQESPELALDLEEGEI
ncbi:amino acid adenylation domain-containing protein [Marinomonas sp. PE14-40]|uniref:amino acid adenylation domain-containing protein n=1 Tax=Marinomonas sp. PE14-40 TaxID=3060621 RepID=UPI003F681FE3